jgi:hypothetical protein
MTARDLPDPTQAARAQLAALVDDPELLADWRSVPWPDGVERAVVFRTPVADLLSPANRYTTVIHRDGREWRGPAFLVEADGGAQLVWGFTAMLLDHLFDRLGWAEPWDPEHTLELP